MPYDYEDTQQAAPGYPLFYQGPRRRRGVNLFGSGSAVPGVPEDQLDDLENMSGYEQAPGTSGVNQFAQLAGLAAQAIDPKSWGGRLGANMAGLAMRNQNRADPYNQMLFQSRMAARGERERQKQLEGVFKRIDTPTTRMGVGYGTPVAPGASPSAFGVPPVTTSLGEQEQVSYSPASMADLFALSQFGGKGMVPLIKMMQARGQVPGGEGVNVPADTTHLPAGYDFGGRPYTAPSAPWRNIPAATPVTSGRPAYSLGGVDYPAVTGAFSPSDTAVRAGGPGHGFIRGPGEPLETVPLTPVQQGSKTVFGPAGSTPFSNITGQPTGPQVAQTGRQQATGVGGKGKGPSERDKAVTDLVAYITTDPSFEATPKGSTWYGGVVNAQSRAQRVMNEWVREEGITAPVQERRHSAWQRAFGKGGTEGKQDAPSKSLAQSVKGQQTNRPDGTYTLKDGSKISVINGIIQ